MPVSIAPDAPIIGTATIIDSTTARVAYTPPSYTGSSAIVSYTVTSHPQGFTATVAAPNTPNYIQLSGLTTNQPYSFIITATNSEATSSPSSSSNIVTPVSSGVYEAIYTPSTSGGTLITATGQRQFTFTVPAGVTSISVVCVGGGGFSIGSNGSGGGGGALAYVNNYSVTPGQTFTVIVGGGPSNIGSSQQNTSSSRNTTFGGTICGAGGGQTNAGSAANNAGGAVLYGTGGAGGIGTYASNPYGGGGGGAGGYSGAGGAGGSDNAAGNAGNGGGGGGGGSSISGGAGGAGGPASFYGIITSGAPGGSVGGYTGSSSADTSSSVASYAGNRYGAGAGSIRNQAFSNYGLGGPGLVRIVWPGNLRQFPATNVNETYAATAPIAGQFMAFFSNEFNI
jgi:hypothetical protein